VIFESFTNKLLSFVSIIESVIALPRMEAVV